MLSLSCYTVGVNTALLKHLRNRIGPFTGLCVSCCSVSFRLQKGTMKQILGTAVQNAVVTCDPVTGFCASLKTRVCFSGVSDKIQVEVKSRLKLGNTCYHSVQKLLSSRLLSKNLKIKIYRTIILPVVLYGCES